jgi:phage-related holin
MKTLMNTAGFSLVIKLSLIFCGNYFLPLIPFVFLIFILTGTDLITGLIASIKTKGIKSLKSRGLKRTTIKIAAYLIALSLTFLFENIIFDTNLILTKIMAGYISLTELASVFENLGKITNKGALFNALFNVLKTYFNKNKDLINKIDPEKDF